MAVNITKESENVVSITGVLKAKEIDEKKTADGRQYVRLTALVGTEVEVDGKVVESEHKLEKMLFKIKKDGTENKMYNSSIADWNKLISVAACPEGETPSRVTIADSFMASKLTENMWLPEGQTEVKSTTKINVGKLKAAPMDATKDEAKFIITGVLLKEPEDEIINNEPTNRLIITIGVFGYCDPTTNPDGNIQVFRLIAASEGAVNWIRNNWHQYDTVRCQGAIINSVKTVITESQEGFGTIQKEDTVSVKEYRITGANPPFDIERSYEQSDVKRAMAARIARKEDVKTKAEQKASQATVAAGGFVSDAMPF